MVARRQCRSRTRRIGLLSLVLLFCLIPGPAASETPGAGVLLLDVTGMITPGTADFIGLTLARARPDDVAAVVLRLDTPGGLLAATLDILKRIEESALPVVAFVAPGGAIAASAGSFILVGSHVSAMAPATSTGAAMPVRMAPSLGGSTRAADEKTVSFVAGYMKSLAERRGRPASVAERFVTDNLTLTAEEAMRAGIADIIALDTGDLLRKLDGRVVVTRRGNVTLRLSDAEVRQVDMSARARLRHVVSNPQVAFALLLLGAFGLYFGFITAGIYLPETAGAIALLLGIYGLGLFEANLGALLLVILGLALLLADAFVAGFGVLGVGGIVSLLLGVLLLPWEPLLPAEWYPAFRSVGLAGVAAALVVVLAVAGGVVRSRRGRVRGAFSPWPEAGVVAEDLAPEGHVLVGGELWRARHVRGETVPAGKLVRVLRRRGLLLEVEGESDQQE